MAFFIGIGKTREVAVRVPIKGNGSDVRLGILRFASLRMTKLFSERIPGKALAIFFLFWGVGASATTYYVSSSTGSDSNSGTSSAAAWQTVAKVNGQTFLPGDQILFRRGDVWNESLAPPSSGASGNPIAFDAYGNGSAPNLTGYYAVPSSAWAPVSGNAWKAPLPASYSTINFCLFGTVWGQKVAAVSTNLTAQWDFYFANGFVYVFSVGNPGSYYNAAIVPMAVSNVPVININGQSWLTFQHFLLNWFDQYGVYVQGTSDHLVFANMEADSLIPQGTQPLGFYVNESAPGPADIKIYNDEAHMNYDGFRFDGSATAIAMVNDKAYANRDAAMVDNTGAVSYSYCHFYASSLAVAGSTDVLSTSGPGPTAGAGNIAGDTPPAVQAWQRYPAEISLTVDDVGMTAGADSYYATQVLPVADAAGVPVGTAITVGYAATMTPSLIAEIQGWINDGIDVTAHSVSHTYYTNTDALEIQYTGSGTAATLSISGKVLTISVTGAGDSVSYNLAQGQPQGTLLGLIQALNGTGKFTTSEATPCQGPYGTGCSAYTAAALLTQDLADVSGQDVKSGVYHMQLDVTRLTTDEITLSRQWMTANLTGLPATPVYVYPGGYEDPNMEAITAGVPFSGARGALHEGGANNLGQPNTGVKDTYASGFNVQNITSFGVNPSWQGLPPASLNQKIQALVWKQMVWGVPWGIFWHLNELTNSDPVGGAEITNLIQDFKASGATIQTNTGLVNRLLTGTLETGTDGNTYYKSAGNTAAVDFRPTANSPVVDAGLNLGTAYQIDINGVNQNDNGSGWEIGAHAFIGYSSYGGNTGSSYFTLGGVVQSAGAVQLPQNWVNTNEWTGTATNLINFPASGSGGSWMCGGTSYGPYTANSQSSLAQAVADAESCRAANGSGTEVVIPHGSLFSGSSGIVLPQTAGDNSTNFIVLTSDTPLPAGQTACSHGIQDNIAESTQPGIRNLGCNGSNLSYQLGTTVVPLSAAFTLANGTPTSSAAYNDLASMWTVECTSNGCNGISTAMPDGNGISPHHYAIVSVEVRPQAGLSGPNAPIKIGQGTETAASELPTHIHMAYDYLHGDWTDAPVSAGIATGGATGANSLPADLSFAGCIDCSVSFSYIDRSIRPGAEGHAIYAGLAQQIKVVHNWVEGMSSGTFCGGFAVPIPITGFIGCQDVEDRGNRYTYPYSWMLAQAGGFCVNGLTCSGNSYVRKNGHELKVGQRYLFDGNIIENVDNSGAQNGIILSFKSDNGAAGTNTWIVQTDTTATNNLMRDSCNGPSFGFRSAGPSNGGGVAFSPVKYSVQNNLLYGTGAGIPGCTGVSPLWGFRVADTGAGLTWSAAVSRDVLGLTSTLTLTSAAGQAVSDSNVGDPVSVSNCSDPTFNTDPTVLGPPAMAGTLTNGLTIVYSNPGAAGATATGCTYSEIQGWPQYLTFNHNSSFNSSGTSDDPFSSAAGGTTPEALARNIAFTNGVVVNGGINSTFAEGTRTETKAFDATTLVINNLLLPGRDSVAQCPSHLTAGPGGAVCYTEYGGPNAGASPPVTIYLSPTSFCTGSDPTTGNCSGILGAMSTSSFPTLLADWHQYRLCHTGDAACNSKASLFAAGQAQQASDGTDLGANVAAIDTAETSTRYACETPCGAGPSRDVAPQVEVLAPGAAASVPEVNTYLKPSPYIHGIVYSLYWACSDQDGTSAHYTWAGFDNQIIANGWAAAGKKIMVVLGGVTYGGSDNICYGGAGFGTSGVGNYGTPAYVWTALGSANYATCSGEQIPNYLNSAYLNNYKNWVAATLAHLAASPYATSIQYVRVAWGKGGETTPIANWDAPGNCPDGSGNNTLTTDWGYTLPGWETFLHNGMTFETGLNLPLQLMISITPMGTSGGSQAAMPNFTAPIAASLGIGFGTQGLMASDVNNAGGCGGNWCNLFATYAGRVPLETQTFFQSCAPSNESGTCPSMAVTTGPLNPLLMWAAREHATSFEMYYEDALAILLPGYSNPGYAAYSQPYYMTALQAVVSGNF